MEPFFGSSEQNLTLALTWKHAAEKGERAKKGVIQTSWAWPCHIRSLFWFDGYCLVSTEQHSANQAALFIGIASGWLLERHYATCMLWQRERKFFIMYTCARWSLITRCALCPPLAIVLAHFLWIGPEKVLKLHRTCSFCTNTVQLKTGWEIFTAETLMCPPFSPNLRISSAVVLNDIYSCSIFTSCFLLIVTNTVVLGSRLKRILLNLWVVPSQFDTNTAAKTRFHSDSSSFSLCWYSF